MLLIVVAIVLTALSFGILRMVQKLSGSSTKAIRYAMILSCGLFTVYQGRLLTTFILDANGKSLTVGWFALAYSSLISSAILAGVLGVICYVDYRLS